MKKPLIFVIIIWLVIAGFGMYNNIALNSLESRADALEKKVKEIEKNMPRKEVKTEINYIYGTATAYHPASGGINSDGNPEITATGQPAEPGVIAVNPDVIPYGSQVMIIHEDTVIRGVAEDTGGAMKRNPTQGDILMGNLQECIDWGRRDVHIIWW